MSKLIEDNTLLKKLKTEKLNGPDLTEVQKLQLTNRVLKKAHQQSTEPLYNQKSSFRYFLIAAIAVLGVGVFQIILIQPEVTKPSASEVVTQNFNISHAQAFQDMVEKWDPDVLGGYASQFLIAKANPTAPFDKELRAFHTLGTGLVSSFYDEFKHSNQVEEN